MIKPTKIAGSFVLFGGGSVEAANVTLYSAFSAMPKTYDERKALPGMFTMFHTPVLLGRSRGIFCGVCAGTAGVSSSESSESLSGRSEFRAALGGAPGAAEF